MRNKTTFQYNTMINTRHFEQAQQAYDNAMTAGIANVVTHSSMITAAGNTGHFEQAQQAYGNAMTAAIANKATHRAFRAAQQKQNTQRFFQPEPQASELTFNPTIEKVHEAFRLLGL